MPSLILRWLTYVPKQHKMLHQGVNFETSSTAAGLTSIAVSLDTFCLLLECGRHRSYRLPILISRDNIGPMSFGYAMPIGGRGQPCAVRSTFYTKRLLLAFVELAGRS